MNDMSRLGAAAFLAGLLLTACGIDFSLPEPPGAGSVTGRLVVAVPGRLDPQPAVGAEAQILGSNLADVADDEGRFILTPITSSTGQILIRYAQRADGTWARQRLLDLSDIDAAPGRDINLGDILLFENATIEGVVRRGDSPGLPRGQSGTTIFLPEGPYTTQSGDDGSYLLQAIPPGNITLAFFRDGYAPATVGPIAVQPGESVRVREVILEPDGSAPGTVTARGAIAFQPDAPDATAATVVARSTSGEVTLPVAADGTYESELPAGIYTFEYDHADYGNVVRPNLLLLDTDGTGVLDLPLVTLIEGQDDVVPPDPGADLTAESPVARIVSPTAGRAGASFILDASGSTQADSHALSYRWRQTGGDAVTLDVNDAPEAVSAGFIAPPAAQTLAFELEVTDLFTGKTGSATTDIVFGVPPAVSVVAPDAVQVGDTVTLDASATTNGGGGALLFSWRQSRGDTVALSDNDSDTAAVASFIAPPTEQTLTFGLTVTDTVTGLAGTASLVITVLAPPVAAALPPPVVAVGETATLDGTLSTVPPGGVASYLWTQTGGPAVTFSDNDSAFAGLVTFDAPDTTGALTFDLTVTDVRTSLTDTTSVAVLVARRPTAIIDPTALTVRSSTTLRFDGAGSVSPTGAPLTYQWAVAGNVGSIDSTDLTTNELLVTTGTEAFSVTLTVNDGTLSSPVATTAVVIDDLAIPNPTLTVAPIQTVNLASTAVMETSATHPNPAEIFTFTWSQLSGTPVTLVPVSVDADTSQASFITPGAPEQMTFSVQVDGSSGGSTTAQLVIEVVDRTPPVVVAMDPVADGGTGSWMYASVTFDEPIDPTSLDQTTLWLEDSTGAKVPARLQWDPATLTAWVFPDVSLAPAGNYTLNVGAITDAALIPNARTTTTTRSFVARAPRWTGWSRTLTTTESPYPGVTLDENGGVLVFARTFSASTRLAHVLAPNGTGGLTTLASSTSTVSGSPPRGNKRALTVGGKPLYHLTGPGTYITGGVAVFNGATLPTRNGEVYGLFSDGLTLAGTFESYGLHMRVWNGTGWDDNYLESSSGTGYSYHKLAMDGAASQGGRFVVITSRRDANPPVPYNAVLVREWTGPGSFTQLAGSGLGGSIDNSYDTNWHPDVMATFAGETPVAAFIRTSWGASTVGASWWDDAGTAWVILPNAGTATEIAMAAVGRTLYLARVQTSRVFLDRIALDAATPTWESVPGPVNTALNLDLACLASSPEMLAADDALYIAFSETCDGGATHTVVLHELD